MTVLPTKNKIATLSVAVVLIAASGIERLPPLFLSNLREVEHNYLSWDSFHQQRKLRKWNKKRKYKNSLICGQDQPSQKFQMSDPFELFLGSFFSPLRIIFLAHTQKYHLYKSDVYELRRHGLKPNLLYCSGTSRHETHKKQNSSCYFK